MYGNEHTSAILHLREVASTHGWNPSIQDLSVNVHNFDKFMHLGLVY